MEERQKNYTVAEGYELPSGGLIYATQVNPHVELRSMTARDEMKRLSPSTTPLKTLADIIEGCLIEPPAIHVYDMCIGDYEYLLHKLRIVSYGCDYKVVIGCPNCGGTTEAIVNLETLTEREFNIEEFNELLTVELPRTKKIVKLKFQTPHTLDTIAMKTKEFKRKYKEATIDFEMLSTLLVLIDTVDGIKLNSFDLENFINNLPVMDMTKILNTLTKLNNLVGLDTEFFVACKECGEEVTTFFRFGTEFFRPTTI